MMDKKYYSVLKSGNKNPDLVIKWNVPAISNGNNETGFILQHMRIDSHIDFVESEDYWETWHVTDGRIEGETECYDDNWSPIPNFVIADYEDEINESSGIINYFSKVYWIPKESDVYKIVEQWSPDVSSPAQELKMAYQFHQNIDEYFVFDRLYSWNYKNILQDFTK